MLESRIRKNIVGLLVIVAGCIIHIGGIAYLWFTGLEMHWFYTVLINLEAIVVIPIAIYYILYSRQSLKQLREMQKRG